MLEPGHLISRLWHAVFAALILAGLGAYMAPRFHPPELVYFTQDLAAYPLESRDNVLVPGGIEGNVIVGGPIKILNLMVQNKGVRSIDVSVRIPFSADDGYLIGWMSKNEDPSTRYMLDRRTEYRFRQLLPGDTVSFDLYLKNASSDLAGRIEVFDGDGHRAAYYPSVPVRYVGGDEVIVSIRKELAYLFGFVLVVTLFMSVWHVVEPR